MTHSAESPELELSRLELVSLLKFDTPRVYVSNQNLPQLDQSHKAPTRALNPFETAALALLEKGEDFVFNEHGPHILAFGSLRAGTECLKCHEVQRGGLVGGLFVSVPADSGRPNRTSAIRRSTSFTDDESAARSAISR